MLNIYLKLKENIKKTLVFLIITLLFFGSLLIIYKKEILEVDFLDIGQGDASLIRLPTGQTVLIDGGPDNLVLRRLGEVLPFYRRRIDYLVFSHYHDDHITGLIEVMKRYQVSRIIYAESEYNSPILEEFFQTARKRKIPILLVKNRLSLNFLPGCGLSFFAPQVFTTKKDENNSLIARLDCRGKKFLFSGDNNRQVEKGILASNYQISTDVFKASHHGSKTANSEIFLAALRPSLLVISDGADNKFGHPSLETLDLASKLGIKVRRTDQTGTIRVIGP